MLCKLSVVLFCAIGLAQSQNGYSRDNPQNQLNYGNSGSGFNNNNNYNNNNNNYNNNGNNGNSNDYEESSGGEIPGEPGRDYPVYDEVPETSFSCNNQQYPGYYADPESQCQAFYICQRGGKSDAFLCPKGSIFNQEFLVCDWWYNVDCSRAEELYSVNEQVVRAMEEADARLSEQKQQQNSGYNYNGPSQDTGFQNGNGNGHHNGNGNGNGHHNGNENGNGHHNGNGNGNGHHNGNGNGNRNGNGHNNGNRFNDQNRVSPVYGPPAQFSGALQAPPQHDNGFGHQNGNGNRHSENGFHGNGNGHQKNGKGNGNGFSHNNGNGHSSRPTFGASGSGFRGPSGLSNGFNRNGNSGPSNDAPNRSYLPPSGNGNNGHSSDDLVYQNGLGNGPTIPNRNYLPPRDSGFSSGNSPSSQYGVPNHNGGSFNLNDPNAYNGNPQNGHNPNRSYLPPQ